MDKDPEERLIVRSSPAKARQLETARRLSYWLDSAFRIPGTRFRFGWDPLIGLIPGLGDVVTALTSLFIILQAFRMGVPHVIKARMFLNILIDIAVGAVPLIGDIFDFAWKSNSMNLALLEKHGDLEVKPGASDWIFVLGTVAAVLTILITPILILVLLLDRLEKWMHAPLF